MESPKLSLGEVLEAMRQRGDVADAMLYQIYATEYLEIIHGIPLEESLKLPIDTVVDLLLLPPKPLKYTGWNTFIWGEAATRVGSSG